MNLFIISDIHGMYVPFKQLLDQWDLESKLVILGDMIDRGPQSLDVLRRVMDLKATYGEQIIVCKGNHEDMFLKFLKDPKANKDIYYRNGGLQTMDSFLSELPNDEESEAVVQHAALVKEQFKEEISFLENLDLYAVVGDVLLTHAGFDTQFADVNASKEHDFIWIRDHYLKENLTPYRNVFGHTPVRYIHKQDDIWMSEDGKYIGIDGGCYYGGQLNALIISDKGEVLNTLHEMKKE